MNEIELVGNISLTLVRLSFVDGVIVLPISESPGWRPLYLGAIVLLPSLRLLGGPVPAVQW